MSVARQSLFISKETKALASPPTVAIGKVSLPAFPERGQEDEDPAFVNSGSSLAVQEDSCENIVYSGPSHNLQIETNNSGDICNYGKRVFTEWEKTD